MEIEKLYPVCKDYIWGGTKLKEKYGKISDKDIIAESWELSFHKDGLAKLYNGEILSEKVTKKDLGTNTEKFPFFPMLIKLIDAKDNLSVQVHPSDEYALKNENSYGKTEMWYIVEAEENAGIYLGLKEDTTKEEFIKAINNNTLTNLLNFYPVKKGEHYFIESGTIHAIGKGCLICEIQQNSNLTYRVYDYNRKDKEGNKRELHIEKAIKVSNLNKFINNPLNEKTIGGTVIGRNKYFTVVKYEINDSLILETKEDTFNSITCIEGSGEIENQKINLGDTFFIPANYGKYKIKGNLKLILAKV